MIPGMDDLVVMPTLTHVDNLTLKVVRPGGMTSWISSNYKLTTTTVVVSSFVTGQRAVCVRSLASLSRLLLI
jgi:hypothetical protein